MSEREAAVKLTLDGAQFSISIKKIGDEVEKTSEKGKRGMTAFAAGTNAAKKSMMDLGGMAKQTLGMAASLGGAFTLGTAVKSAVELQSTYSDLAYRVQQATGQMMKSSEVQLLAERSAARTTRTSGEMAQAFGDVLQATGDLDFSRDVLDAIGTAATATGKDVSFLAGMADQLHTKFGVGASAMLGTFAKLNELSAKGGPSFEQFGEVMSSVGAELMAAGLDGERGLNFMIGALNQTDDALKSLPKQVRGLQAVLRGLGETGELNKLAGKLGIDPKKLINEKDALARLHSVFEKGKAGVDALLAPLHEGEEKQTMKILFTDPFEKALADATKNGLKGRAAIDAALAAFDEQIKQFGKGHATAASMAEQAARKAQEPAAKLRVALNDLGNAFGQPEIISAINDLAKHLPDLAKLVADIVTFVAKHPIAGAAIGVGGKVGVDFLGGAAKSILSAHLAGGRAAKEGIEAGAQTLGANVKESFDSVSSTMGTLGKAFGVAASAYLVYKVGTAAIDEHFDDEDKKMKRVQDATRGAAPKNAADRDAQIKELEESMAGSKDVGSGFFNGAARAAAGVTDLVSGGDGNVPDSRMNAWRAQRSAQARIEELRDVRFGESTVASVAPVTSATQRAAAPAPKIDPHMIGVAMAGAMGSRGFDVRISNGAELGLGRAQPGPGSGGGSRGPRQQPPTAPGGGH
jgi:hypothetical protein